MGYEIRPSCSVRHLLAMGIALRLSVRRSRRRYHIRQQRKRLLSICKGRWPLFGREAHSGHFHH